MISDLDDDLVYLFGMLANSQEGPDLLKRLLKLQYSKSEFLCARTAKKTNYLGLEKYRHAELIYILITQSFNNARQSYRNSGVSQRDYEFMLQANLPNVCRRLQNVVVCKMNCIDAVDKLRDNEKVFVLLDVPYCWEMPAEGSCRIYGHEMNNDEHRKLLSVCKDARCKIMLFGYRSEDGSDLYDQMLGIPGSHWNHYTLARVVKSCQTKATKDIATLTSTDPNAVANILYTVYDRADGDKFKVISSRFGRLVYCADEIKALHDLGAVNGVVMDGNTIKCAWELEEKAEEKRK